MYIKQSRPGKGRRAGTWGGSLIQTFKEFRDGRTEDLATFCFAVKAVKDGKVPPVSRWRGYKFRPGFYPVELLQCKEGAAKDLLQPPERFERGVRFAGIFKPLILLIAHARRRRDLFLRTVCTGFPQLDGECNLG